MSLQTSIQVPMINDHPPLVYPRFWHQKPTCHPRAFGTLNPLFFLETVALFCQRLLPQTYCSDGAEGHRF